MKRLTAFATYRVCLFFSNVRLNSVIQQNRVCPFLREVKFSLFYCQMMAEWACKCCSFPSCSFNSFKTCGLRIRGFKPWVKLMYLLCAALWFWTLWLGATGSKSLKHYNLILLARTNWSFHCKFQHHRSYCFLCHCMFGQWEPCSLLMAMLTPMCIQPPVSRSSDWM